MSYYVINTFSMCSTIKKKDFMLPLTTSKISTEMQMYYIYGLFGINLDLLRDSVCRVEELEIVRKLNSRDQYIAYVRAGDLYKHLLPRLTNPGKLECDKLTNEQAKIIFPLYVHAQEFNLQNCPNLTGHCLSYKGIPPAVTRITAPFNTEYKHLRNLPKTLERLFVYNIKDRGSEEMLELRDSKLVQLNIPGPSKIHKEFMQLLPITLKILEIKGGELGDVDTGNYLKTSKVEKIGFSYVSKLSADAFKRLPFTINEIFIFNCPDIDIESMRKIRRPGLKIVYKAVIGLKQLANLASSFKPLRSVKK